MKSDEIITQKIYYWRYSTDAEIRKGKGSVRWIEVDPYFVTKPNGTLKKWIVWEDGLRYYR